MSNLRRDAEMDEEMRHHVALLTEQNVAAGMDASQARRAALLAFGSPEALGEAARSARPAAWLGDLARDLAYGARTLRASPGFAAVVVLTLALGLGVNTAIFSLVDGVLLRPLPVRDPAGLVLLSDRSIGGGRSRGQPAARDGRITVYTQPLFERLRAHDDVFEGLAAEEGPGSGRVLRWTSPAGGAHEQRGYARAVSGNYFDVLGVRAFRGRVFGRADEGHGAARALVLNHGFWQRSFGGDPDVVGAGVWLDDEPFTVVGVAPPAFAGTMPGNETDLWLALSPPRDLVEAHGHWWLRVFGRLRPGVSAPAAEALANVTLQAYLAEGTGSSPSPTPAAAGGGQGHGGGVRIGIDPGARGFTRMRDGFRQPLGVSMAAASLLLLIVCLNVSHLLLARAVGRQREVTIRAALGATRARLLRQLPAEALLLAGLGAVAAAAVRRWISEGLLFMAAVESQARSLDVGADGRVVAFTVLVTLATAALIGGIPAWKLSSRGAHLHGALRETSHLVADGRSRGTARGLLLASQVALSLVLLVGAGLLYATLGKMRALGEGFYEDHVLLADLRVKGTGPVETRNAVYGDLISRVSALPGVLGAGAATYPPLGGSSTGATLLLPDRGPEPVEIDFVTPGYLEALGIGTIAGRGFDRRDRQGAPRVAVVNETFARRFLSRGDVASALGRRIRFDPTKKPKMLGADFDVVGVVKDAKTRALKQEPGPAAYLSVDQADRFSVGSLAIRVDPRAGSPARLGQRIRRVLQDHPGVAATSVTLTTMREQLERSLRHERLLALLAGAFGLAALSLVCLGLYGVISQWAAQRSAEIGVRVALGAPPAGVRWMVMRQALALVAAGVAVGLPAALGASHLLRGALFGVEPMDPPPFTLAAAAMFAVTMAAAYLPARRATRTDLMTALRHE